MAAEWWVYILECAGGSLYTGIATDVERRFAEHRDGKGARYTRSRTPLRIVYREPCQTRSAALKREAAIKKLPTSRKRALLLAFQVGVAPEAGFVAPKQDA